MLLFMRDGRPLLGITPRLKAANSNIHRKCKRCYKPLTVINILVPKYARIYETVCCVHHSRLKVEWMLVDFFKSLQVHVPLILPTVHCPVTTCELMTTLIQAANSTLATLHFRYLGREDVFKCIQCIHE